MVLIISKDDVFFDVIESIRNNSFIIKSLFYMENTDSIYRIKLVKDDIVIRIMLTSSGLTAMSNRANAMTSVSKLSIDENLNYEEVL